MSDEEKLLAFSMRFLKPVLFGEQSFPLIEGAREIRIEARKDAWLERKQQEQARWQELQELQELQEDQKYSSD